MGIPTIKNTFANGVSGFAEFVNVFLKTLRKIWDVDDDQSGSNWGFPARHAATRLPPKTLDGFCEGKSHLEMDDDLGVASFVEPPKQFDSNDLMLLIFQVYWLSIFIHPNHDSNHLNGSNRDIQCLMFLPKSWETALEAPWGPGQVVPRPPRPCRGGRLGRRRGSTREDRVVPQMLPRWFISKLVD